MFVILNWADTLEYSDLAIVFRKFLEFSKGGGVSNVERRWVGVPSVFVYFNLMTRGIGFTGDAYDYFKIRKEILIGFSLGAIGKID